MEVGKIGGTYISPGTVNDMRERIQDESFESRLKKVLDKKDEEELKKVCEDFEAIFLSMMYKEMKATVSKSTLIPKGAGREVFESMLDEALMEKASRSHSLGLAESMYRQISAQLSNVYKAE